MSVFTNSASRSVEEAQTYTRAVLGLLGERDPVDVLERTPGALHALAAGLAAPDASVPEAPGKWSVREVLQHLADSELVWGYRLRLVLAQDRPPLTGYDQDAWAARLEYAGADMSLALQDFTALRQSNLRLLQRATAADLARVGVHAERGEESIAHMIRLYAGHDLLHVQQIERIRAAIRR